MGKLKYLIGIIAIVGILVYCAQMSEAAEPLSFEVEEIEVFRHILEDNDWLILGRLYLIPESSTAYSDHDTINMTSGDFDNPLELVNRVHVTGETDFAVTIRGADFTDYCFLQVDGQSIQCTNTGLSDGAATSTAVYRSGWRAYNHRDVTVRLIDSTTIVAERSAERIGYGLLGLYLTAADVSTYSLSWGDANIGVRVIASPVLWDNSYIRTVPVSTWHAGGSIATSRALLEARLRHQLEIIEQDDPNESTGSYVYPEYITDDGTLLAFEAFSMIGTALPTAFASGSINPNPTPIATPAQSEIDRIVTDVQATNLWSTFNTSHPLLGTFFTIIGSIIIAGLFGFYTRNPYLVGVSWYGSMFTGWLLFAIPGALIVIPAAAFAAVGLMFAAKKVFD